MSRFPHRPYPIENVNGRLYEILAEYEIIRVKDARLIKEWVGADTAFKVNSKGVYIFCREIEDVQWEEI